MSDCPGLAIERPGRDAFALVHVLFFALSLLFPVLLPSCATPPGVVEKSRPVAYDSLPKSAVNSNGLAPGTTRLLEARGLAGVSRRDPAKAIAALESPSSSAADLDPARRLALAELCLREARALERSRPDAAIGWYLAAAEHAFPVAPEKAPPPESELLAAIGTHSTGKAAVILYSRKHDFGRPATFAGPGKTYTLVTPITGPGLLDPRHFDTLTPADLLVIHGIRSHSTLPGFGAPLVGYRARTPERQEADHFLAPIGRVAPVTATLAFEKDTHRAVLRFHDRMTEDTARVGAGAQPLAADFTAPFGVLVGKGAPERKLALKAVFRPEILEDRTGLYFLTPLRRDKIPVVFVHGLMSDPATWLDTFNELIVDPVIRENYQFWYFIYPTGNPIGHSGAGLRRELREVRETYPAETALAKFNQVVLVGHSMGGIVSNLQVRTGGDDFWFRFSKIPIDELDVDAETRERLRASVYFQANPQVSRIIFAATPHRGSGLAQRPISKLLSNLINLPFDALSLDRPQIFLGTTELGRAVLDAGMSGLSNLRPDDPRLLAILDAPMSKRVTYHSIIGNRGKKGPLEKSSDGVVPYTSSHLDGAASEKIVPSGHGAHTHPEGVAEIRRILLEHLRR